MTRNPIPEIQMNIRLPVALIDDLDKFCETRGVKKKEIVELAVRRFLVAEKEKPL